MSALIPEALACFWRGQVRIRHLETCDTCGGSGVKPGSKISVCGQCGGSGVVIQTTRTPLGAFQTQTTCPTCRGTGEVGQPGLSFMAMPGASRSMVVALPSAGSWWRVRPAVSVFVVRALEGRLPEPSGQRCAELAPLCCLECAHWFVGA